MKCITKYIYAIEREFQNDPLLVNAQTTMITQRDITEVSAVQTFFYRNVSMKNGKGWKISLTKGS